MFGGMRAMVTNGQVTSTPKRKQDGQIMMIQDGNHQAPMRSKVKKVVKKVAPKKKVVKKVAPKKSGKMSYAMQQKQSLGSKGFGSFGAITESVNTLLTPTQLAYISVWVLLVLKFLIFYPASE